MNNYRNIGLCVLLIAIGLLVSSQVVHAVCGDCAPQCGTYAKQRSGITCSAKYAKDLCKCGSATDKPKEGCIIILDIGTDGHALYVESSDSKGNNEYALKISQTNFTNGCDCGKTCCLDSKIKATYNGKNKTKTLTIQGGKLHGTYNVLCIRKK